MNFPSTLGNRPRKCRSRPIQSPHRQPKHKTGSNAGPSRLPHPTNPVRVAFTGSTVQSIPVSIPAHGTNNLGRSHDSGFVGSSLQELRPSNGPRPALTGYQLGCNHPGSHRIQSIPDRSHRNDHPHRRHSRFTLVAKSRSSDCRGKLLPKSPHPHPSTTTRSFPLAVAAALRTKSLRRTHRRPHHPHPQRSLCANRIVGPHRNTNRLAVSDHKSPPRQPTLPTHTVRVSNRLERTIGIVRAVLSPSVSILPSVPDVLRMSPSLSLEP